MNFSGKSITKNTVYNLLGYGIPMFVAILCIPALVRGLGTERFGLLNLAWIVIGYFSFFDFGIGKGLTKIVAEKISTNLSSQIPGLFWSSMILMVGISISISLILLFFIRPLVDLVNISAELRIESIETFYILVISIPIVTTTAGLRGFLEAYQKFGLINIMRVFLGILTFVVPLISLFFSKSLVWIVFLLLLMRVIVWLVYLINCYKVNSGINKSIAYDFELAKPVYKFSLWITVANIVGPLLTNVDRFLIGALISAKAVAYYATPLEIVSRLLLIPNALVAVLFPIFSASFLINSITAKKYFYSGTKFIYLALYPVVFIIVAFSFLGLNLWLGEEFAHEGSLILQLLAIAILINGIAYIPFNFFQGIGKPNIPAILNLVELPFYLFLMWISIKTWGINGAAFICLSRIILDSGIIFYLAYRRYGFKFESRKTMLAFSCSIICLFIPILIENTYFNAIFSIITLLLFFIIVIKYFVTTEEKLFFLNGFGGMKTYISK